MCCKSNIRVWSNNLHITCKYKVNFYCYIIVTFFDSYPGTNGRRAADKSRLLYTLWRIFNQNKWSHCSNHTCVCISADRQKTVQCALLPYIICVRSTITYLYIPMQLILKVLDPLDEMIQTKYQNDYQDCVIVFSSVYRFDNKLIHKPIRLHRTNLLHQKYLRVYSTI